MVTGMLCALGRRAAWKGPRLSECVVKVRVIWGRACTSIPYSNNSKRMKPNAVVGIMGAEAEKNSSAQLMGTKDGPDHIRTAMRSKSLNSTTEQFVDVHGLHTDYGNITEADYETTEDFHEALQTRVKDIVSHDLVPVTLGGDHSITYPLVMGRAAAGNPSEFAIIHLDAHTDIYEDFEGNPYSHASPFARILEASPSPCTKLIQIGIRSTTFHQRIEQAKKYDVEVMDMKSLTTIEDTLGKINKILPPDFPVYLTIDLDSMDPAFAPGTNCHEPGGLTSRFVLDLVEELSQKIVGADVVELCPKNDLNEMTAMVGAKITREIITHVALQRGSKSF